MKRSDIAQLSVVMSLVLGCLASPLAAVARSSDTASRVVQTALLGVAFSSRSDGVGLFEVQLAVGSPAHSSETELETRVSDDGGERFGPPGAPIAREADDELPSVDQLASDGLGDLFAFGPELFVSHTEGASWTRVRLVGTVDDVVAVGASIWALTSTCPTQPAPVSCRVTLVTSSDGGRSWVVAVHQPPRRATFLLDRDRSLARTDTDVATLVVGGIPGPHGVEATVEITSDGGRTWRLESLRVPGLTVGPVADAFDGTIWLASASEPGTGAQLKTLERSTDDGRHWSGTSMPIGGYLGDLAATSATTVCYTGGRSSLTCSRDGGHTWRVVPGFSGQADGSAQVTFVNPKVGWSIDGFGRAGSLWRTNDGGVTWSRVWP